MSDLPDLHLYDPRMPEVDTPANLPTVFAKVRASLKSNARRCVAIVTPGRMAMLVPAPAPGTVRNELVDQVKALLPSEHPLNIAAIAYNRIESLREDVAKCIPMLPQLLGFAYVGHSVIVFEGHPSALEAALAESHVLVVDSGMLPFLQKDWAGTAARVMRPGARMLLNDRKTLQSLAVKPTHDQQGWRLADTDGEASYPKCLLTTLAKSPSAARVEVAAAPGVPALTALTTDAAQLAWIAGLPFRYEALDGTKVIAILRKIATWSLAEGDSTTGSLNAKLATGAGRTEDVAFQLRLLQDALGRDRVEIERTEVVN